MVSKSSWIFRNLTFSKFQYLAITLVMDAMYEHLKSQNNNPIHSVNDQLDYALPHYFVEFEISIYNIDIFFINLLIKPILIKLSYYNRNM